MALYLGLEVGYRCLPLDPGNTWSLIIFVGARMDRTLLGVALPSTQAEVAPPSPLPPQ